MRSQWTVSKNSWHGRLYLFWKRHAKFKTDGYRENLCHYVRVLLFWAPLSLFTNLHHSKHRWLRPWSLLLGVSAPTALAATTYMWPGEVGKAVLISLAILTGAALFIGLCALIGAYEYEITTWNKKWLPRLLGWIPRLGGAVGKYLILPLFRGLSYPFMRVHETVIPWAAFLTVVAWIVACVIQPMILVFTGAALLIGAAFVGLGIGIYLAIVKLRDWSRKRHPKPKRTEPSFRQVAQGFVVAKKHRICPLIDVEE